MQSRYRALPFLALALASGYTRAEAAARPEDKIAPWVMEKTSGGGTAEFLVVLAPQADLSPARALVTKAAKGRFVRDALWNAAQASQGPLLAELQARGAPHRAYYIVNAVWVKGDHALVLALAARSDVARIEGNPVIQNVLPQPEGPGAETPDFVEPGINYSRAPQVWALGFTGQGIVVGGQDTGYHWTHNALKPHYRGWDGTTANHDFNWHDSIHSGGGICGANSPVPCDDFFHGSHTMGTAVGHDSDTPPGVNQIGMAPGAKWIGCRNMDQGAGTPTTYIECFEFLLAPYPVGGNPSQGDPALAPDVTVNSWGCPPSEGCSPGSLLAAVQAQRAAGIVTEMSAGNSGSGCSTVTDPAAIYDESFTTGALNTSTDTLASFSSRGPVTVDGSNRVKPDISAPGTNTRSCTNTSDSSYGTASGTSMAGPHVAGAIALLLSAVPALSGNPDAIEQRMGDTAFRISTSLCSSTAGVYPNNLFGNGRLDALCAVHGMLSNVNVTVVGPTTVCPTCTGGTATATDTGGGPTTHQWGFRTTSGGPITNIPGQTGSTYVINGADFPGVGSYFLVEVSTSTAGCGAPLVSNEVPITVAAGLSELTIDDTSMPEGNAGTTTATFTVTLSPVSAQTVTVDFATADGTATTANNDYVATSGTLTFAPGVATQPIPVTVVGDTAFEPDETFVVNLSNPGNATITDSQGVGTIVNDDVATGSSFATELFHGYSELEDLAAVGGVPNEDFYRIAQKPYSSYEVLVDATSGDIGPVLQVQRIGPDGTTVLQNSDPIAAALDFSRSLRWANTTATEVTTETVRVASGGCTTDCGPDDVYRIHAFETTYSIPRFNNSGTQITVLLLQNPTNYPISGNIYFWDSTGALIATTPFAFPAAKAVLVLNTATVAPGVGGSVTVAHDGRYGDLSGKTVALEPATGFSFDSPLLPRVK